MNRYRVPNAAQVNRSWSHRSLESLESRHLLSAVPFSAQVIIDDLDHNGANAVDAADLDGDNDVDVVVGSYIDNRLAWYENHGDHFEHHIIADDVTDIRTVLAEDLNGDGIAEVVAGASFDGEVRLYNNDGQANFAPPRILTSSANGVRSLASGDMDGDGDLDLLSAAYLDDKIGWYENLGDGLFTSQKTIATNLDGVRSIETADINGDGHLDVVVAITLENDVSWFAGDGTGIFGAKQDVPTLVERPYEVKAGDFDGDGDIDLTTAAYASHEIVWHENLGDGVFAIDKTLATDGQERITVDASDLDGDGDLDIIAGSRIYDTTVQAKVVWFDNTDGQGAFKREQFISFNTALGIEQVLAADLDSDGDNDVISISSFDNKIAWHENDGTARFGPQITISNDASGAGSVDLADFNGDGHLDVLAGANSDNGVSWYQGDGRGGFSQEKIITTTGLSLQGVRAGDLDGDGIADAISASFNDNKIAWYRNLDGRGDFGEPVVLNSLAAGAVYVHIADLDGDGDNDVLSASINDATIAWYENLDGQGNFSQRIVLSQRQFGAEWVSTADLDGDGDFDVVSAAYYDQGKVAWYRNEGQGNFSSAITVHTGGQPTAVEAIDWDGDGDLDLAITLYRSASIVWSENLDGEGDFGESLPVVGGLTRPETLVVADVDDNGIDDLVTASQNAVVWLERVGNTVKQHAISSDVLGVFGLQAADIDTDGDLDVFSASVYDSKIAWYENELHTKTDADFDDDGNIDAADVDLLCQTIRDQTHEARFDLTEDSVVDNADLDELIFGRLGSTYGDANLDGIFNSSDLVLIFQAGKYEQEVAAGWADGDWNCDGLFGSGDLTVAFIQGDYTAGNAVGVHFDVRGAVEIDFMLQNVDKKHLR